MSASVWHEAIEWHRLSIRTTDGTVKSLMAGACWGSVGVIVEWSRLPGAQKWDAYAVCTEPDSKRRSLEEFHHYYGEKIPSSPPEELLNS